MLKVSLYTRSQVRFTLDDFSELDPSPSLIVNHGRQIATFMPWEIRLKAYTTHLLPCSFLYDPPYLVRVPRMSTISGMKLANMAWSEKNEMQGY